MNMKKLATLVSAVALSATVSANAMAKDTIALVVSWWCWTPRTTRRKSWRTCRT